MSVFQYVPKVDYNESWTQRYLSYYEKEVRKPKHKHAQEEPNWLDEMSKAQLKKCTCDFKYNDNLIDKVRQRVFGYVSGIGMFVPCDFCKREADLPISNPRGSLPLHVHELPSEEQLNVKDIPLTSAALKASGYHLGRQCDHANKEFMLCRSENNDSRLCVKEGRLVSECTLDFFMKIKDHCSESYTEYWTCLDTHAQDLNRCRKRQGVFDKCVLDKLGWVRPEVGDLSKVTVVKTERPMPAYNYDAIPNRPKQMIPTDLPQASSKHRHFLFIPAE